MKERHETVESTSLKTKKKNDSENKFVCGLFSTINPARASAGKRQTTSGRRET